MSRKTVIFGNGLGMALNQEFFALDRAIGVVWEAENILSDEQKQLICNCLPVDRVGRPKGEAELDKLQLALSACELLVGIPGSRIHWLSDEGKLFPNAVRKLIFNTARQFHQSGKVLPEAFLEPFCQFIKKTKSHIGTLNYDNLLYQPMICQGILKGYDGALVDGFHESGFAKENLERRYGRTFGYYLHLHGSPLFVDQNRGTVKLQQSDLANQDDTVRSHIVLTHFKHKLSVISASHVLQSYWQLLDEAMAESDELIVFGYSGDDTHLNLIVNKMPKIRVRVIEWDGAGTETERSQFWDIRFRRNVELVRLANIMDFKDW